ncbi:MAG TPA: DUF3500 domain-containing protein [Xanthobacteraceae bacterium]|nr:DUF3500 domain-containing protein [Xanthobacteraceae bacterium]
MAGRGGLQIDRRGLLAGSAALAAVAALPAQARAQVQSLGSAGDFTKRVQAFLATLDAERAKAARFPWGGQEWKSWNYFGASGYTKPGLRFEQLDAKQKEAGWNLLAAVWSPEGLAKAKNVMLLQSVLASMGDAPDRRSPERFSFSVFGTPSDKGAWGFRFEGHHLTQSVAVRDGRIVSVTPFSFSVRPNRVEQGPHKGLNTLKAEDVLARKLFGDLSPALQAKARISDSPIYNIYSSAGRERANAKKEGLPASSLVSAQRDLLWQLVETYAVEPVPAALKDVQRARVRTGDREAVHFAWHGPNNPNKGFGYRLIGDSFVIEFASVDSEAQHLHTIYHDLGNVLGTST